MKTIGIIGFGSFGKFATEKLALFLNVAVYDSQVKVPKEFEATLEEVCKKDFVILAVPLEAYDEVLVAISDRLSTDSVLVDIASVKLSALTKIREHLPDQKYIATHPLFGPESASTSLAGHTFVWCESNLAESQQNQIKEFLRSHGLEVVEVSAEEHDKEMALVQGLTFFIARALKDMNLQDMRLNTPSFHRLVALAELEKHHSDALFNTIQRGNKYTKQIRTKFIDEVHSLDESI